MGYHTIMALVIGVIGVLHIVYAFITPPPAIEPYVNWSGRRMRKLMKLVPEPYRLVTTRVSVGVLSVVACVTVLVR